MEIVESELGMEAQVCAGQIGGCGLRFGTSCFNSAADPAPDVRFVGGVDRQLKVVVVSGPRRRSEGLIQGRGSARDGSSACEDGEKGARATRTAARASRNWA